MKRNTLTITLFIITLLCFSSAFSQRETLDKIVVVVGEEVILLSEIANQTQIYALQSGIKPKSEEEINKIQEDIIEQMISDRLFLIAARKDTTLIVRDAEIEQALDEQIANIASRFPSDEAFLNAMAQEGISLRQLKKKYRGEVKNQLLKQKFIQSKLYNVAISRFEVEEFYGQLGDSIPTQPEAVRLSHILITFKNSEYIEDSVRAKAVELRQRILDGADFAVISSQFSSTGTKENGGDLGYIAREDVVAEFSRAAFNLKVGDISGVIRTQFGYHIIKCEGKKDDKLKLRHVLLTVMPSAEDSSHTLSFADSLATEIIDGKDFAESAKEFSQDNLSRAKGGELGWIATSNMPIEIAEYVSGWTTEGEIKGPFITSEGLHIFKLLEYSPEKQYSIETDYDRIKEMARQEKTAKMVDKWILKLKEKTYISYQVVLNENR